MLQFSHGSISTDFGGTSRYLSGHNRIGAFVDAPSETPTERAFGEWKTRTLHNLAEAGELCDWLDMHGVEEQGFEILGNATFEVRWRESGR